MNWGDEQRQSRAAASLQRIDSSGRADVAGFSCKSPAYYEHTAVILRGLADEESVGRTGPLAHGECQWPLNVAC
jgi:hypothetical protein